MNMIVAVRKIISALVVLVALLTVAAAQAQSAGSASNNNDDDGPLPPVSITHGPVVESVADTTAIIAWTTNVNSGTTLRYGTDPNRLDQTASMPWGGFTHRVFLNHLQPGTKYFFQAESGNAQGTGTTATAQVLSFNTKTLANAAKQSGSDQP